jgi:hypothetical protein
MDQIHLRDTVWQRSDETEWKIQSRSSAFLEEPPVKWKCERWEGTSFLEHVFEENELTTEEPLLGIYF